MRGDTNILECHPGVTLIDETYLLDQVGKACFFIPTGEQKLDGGTVLHQSRIDRRHSFAYRGIKILLEYLRFLREQ